MIGMQKRFKLEIQKKNGKPTEQKIVKQQELNRIHCIQYFPIKIE